MSTAPTETEYCWVALPPTAEASLDSLAARTDLGGLALRPAAELALEDTILDDAEGHLAARGLTLRLRVEGDQPALLTVKGPSEAAPDGATARAELEQPFSAAALGAAMAFLAERGGPPAPDAPRLAGLAADPESALAELGFEPVQRRRNRRRRSILTAPDGRHLAELALDAVTFTAAGREVQHREVEAELIDGTPEDVAEALSALREVGGADLAPWPHSKTALARTLAEAGERGELGDWLSGTGELTREAYRHIDRRLRG